MKIGLTFYKHEEKLRNYIEWLKSKPGVDVVVLSYEKNNVADVEKCDGIVFSGGEDVNPELYGKPEYVAEQNEHLQMNPERDAFEKQVLAKAETLELPVLGICRGLQFINSYYGGSLFYDLNVQNPSAQNHTAVQKVDEEHEVKVQPDTLLASVAAEGHHVNSSHHQSIDRVAPGFRVNCVSEDGIVEGIERAESDKPFTLCVQWHPERMKDKEKNPLSAKVLDAFIAAVKKHANRK